MFIFIEKYTNICYYLYKNRDEYMNILNKITNKVNNYIDTKKKEQEIYNNMLNNSSIFNLNNIIEINNDYLVTSNEYEYNEMCPYINLTLSHIINGIIPLNETVLNISHITGKKDNQELFLVLTNSRIIILNKEKYCQFNYQDITILNLIRKSFMSQIINFNNVILEIDVNETELNIIYNLITNENYRNNVIQEKIKYLCGIIPIYQRINKIKSGISIDSSNNIVFHDRKINNYLCRYENILDYELMEDNTPVLKKKTRDQSQAMGFSKKECYKMSLRITLTNNQIFEITILEPSTFNSSYSHMDKTYLEYYNFGKEIIEKLETFNKDIY